MSTVTIPETEQARRIAAMRQQAPLPPARGDLAALRQAAGAPASGAPAGTRPAETADTAGAATAAATPPTVRAPLVRSRPPIPGHGLPFSSTPPPEIEQQDLARRLEVERLESAGIDLWAPVPSPDEELHAWHAGRINHADQPPPTPPETLLPELQEAKAARAAAKRNLDEAMRPVVRCESDIALLQRDLDAAKGLPDEIAGHYAAELAAGRPAELDAGLAQRVASRDGAQRKVDALHAALPPLQAKADKAIAELNAAQSSVEAVVVAMVAARGEAIAIEAIAARERYAELRRDLLNLGGMRLGGKGPKLSWRCWQACNDESAKPVLQNDLVQEWMTLARELLADDTDA